MKYTFLYKKHTGEVKAYCEGKPVYDKQKLQSKEITVTQAEYDKILSKQYYMKVKGNKIIFQEKIN